ncbi:hypothetical protein B0H10DRAFT_1960603 [Mycena sp. CBHHK59/15]|nr:hypothetical protein B0H10DRAFT_1960603 [Mycena sp. CBHHK59/15]
MMEHIGGFKCLLSLFSLLFLSPYSGGSRGLDKARIGCYYSGSKFSLAEYTFNTRLQQYEHEQRQRKQDTGDDIPSLLPSTSECRVEREHLYQCEKYQRKHQLQAADLFTCHVHPKHLPTHYMLEPEPSTFDAASFKSSDRGHWLGKHLSLPQKSSNNGDRERAHKNQREALLELLPILPRYSSNQHWTPPRIFSPDDKLRGNTLLGWHVIVPGLRDSQLHKDLSDYEDVETIRKPLPIDPKDLNLTPCAAMPIPVIQTLALQGGVATNILRSDMRPGPFFLDLNSTPCAVMRNPGVQSLGLTRRSEEKKNHV